MPLRLKVIFALVLLVFSLLPPFSTSFPTIQASAQTPVWGFQGAFANYTLIETVGNATVDSGWVSYTVNAVNSTAGTFTMTTEFLDNQLSSSGRGAENQTLIFSLNSSLAFPALNVTDLSLLNLGRLPAGVPNESVISSASVTVKAGTFQADEISDASGQSSIWIDSFSGLVIKSHAVVSLALGSGSAVIETELLTTNVPMGGNLSLNLAFIIVSSVGGVFLLVGIAVAISRRKSLPQSDTPN